jgi:hypothetical protein
MPWVETESLSFTARHDEVDTSCAQRILDALEDRRMRLEDDFENAPGDVTVVIHDNPAALSLAQPLIPLARWSSTPSARRYVAGWTMSRELHLLDDDWMARRAAGPDSLEALRGTAERLYTQLVIAANNPKLPPPWGPRHLATYYRWAWLVEGAAQHFAGQSSLFRPAVINRLREGERPSFPPSIRDALVLGGTVFDLLDRNEGREACVVLVSRLRKDGTEGNLETSFKARFREIEAAWRDHLAEMVGQPDPVTVERIDY